ncbi:MAG: TRAP transporter small permease subunit [Hyphomicrobiaceae bacterium]|nr:TRAP transporter small permease subunit [Hyphomicrobiaceae bacterium]
MSWGTYARLVSRLDVLVAWFGRQIAWLVLALVALVAANVLGRYLFSAGTVALQELEWHLMAVLALVGISYGINRGEEVRVDMLYAHYGRRTKALVDALSAVLMTAVAALLFWLSLSYVGQSYTLGEGSPDPGGLPDRYLLKAMMPVGFALLAAQGLVDLAKAVLRFDLAKAAHQQTVDAPNGK